jgi:hypothetical protein
LLEVSVRGSLPETCIVRFEAHASLGGFTSEANWPSDFEDDGTGVRVITLPIFAVAHVAFPTLSIEEVRDLSVKVQLLPEVPVGDENLDMHRTFVPDRILRAQARAGAPTLETASETTFDSDAQVWTVCMTYSGDIRVVAELKEFSTNQLIIRTEQGVASHNILEMWRSPVIAGVVFIDGKRSAGVRLKVSTSSEFSPEGGTPVVGEGDYGTVLSRRKGENAAKIVQTKTCVTDKNGEFRAPMPFSNRVGITVDAALAWPQVWRFDLVDKSSPLHAEIRMSTTERPLRRMRLVDSKTEDPLGGVGMLPLVKADPYALQYPLITSDADGWFDVSNFELGQDCVLTFYRNTSPVLNGKDTRAVEVRITDGGTVRVDRIRTLGRSRNN